MTSGPAAGWYPDPSGAAGLRWWDGQAWTANTSPGSNPPAAGVPVAPAATVTAPDAQPANPYPTPAYGTNPYAANPANPYANPYADPYAAGAPGGPAGSPYGTIPNTHAVNGGYGYSQGGLRTANGNFFQANRYAFITFGVVAAYILLAITTGFVLIGFIPIAMAVRSRGAREKLAPVAIVAAVASVVVAIATLSGAF